MTEYTIEQFESDFEDASFDKKVDILKNALDIFDTSNPEVKEVLLKFKNEISDIKEQMDIEQDIKCNKDIDSGTLQLYKCIKELDGYVVGHTYYVKIDDVKSLYSSSQVISDKLKGFIDSIKPIIWIYKDNGIGTLKYKTLFFNGKDSENFSEYFEKIK